MSRRYSIYIVMFATCCLATPALAQSLTLSNKLELRLQNRLFAEDGRYDGELVRKPGLNEYLLQKHFQRNAVQPHPDAFLSLTAGRLCGIRRYELSRIDCALQGGEIGATMGLFLGAVGTTTGIWDESSSWYLLGAMTAIGAILGGTIGADEPQWRVRYQWDPEQP